MRESGPLQPPLALPECRRILKLRAAGHNQEDVAAQVQHRKQTVVGTERWFRSTLTWDQARTVAMDDQGTVDEGILRLRSNYLEKRPLEPPIAGAPEDTGLPTVPMAEAIIRLTLHAGFRYDDKRGTRIWPGQDPDTKP